MQLSPEVDGMKKQRIVVALGGNALGNNLPEQMAAVKQTARAIVDLIEQGHQVVIAHGNGPQVGMIQNAMTELTRSDPEKYIPCPLSVCVAMSQGYIGYDLQNGLREELLDRGINKGVATVLTQVEVDPEDPAFQNPTKPIGAFMSKEEADALVKERAPSLPEEVTRSKVGAFVDKLVHNTTAAVTGTGLTLSEETRDLKGGFIMVDGDVEINCAFETLVRLQREQMEKKVADALFQS